MRRENNATPFKNSMTMRRPTTPSRKHHLSKGSSPFSIPSIYLPILAFLLGCIVSASVLLHLQVSSQHHHDNTSPAAHNLALQQQQFSNPLQTKRKDPSLIDTNNLPTSAVLQGLKILVVLVAYDFAQLPHLEEVLDSYHDIAVAGAQVDVYIHATVAYPVVLIDMWNDRFTHQDFTLTIALKSKSLRLHLVDCHRAFFYEHVDEYDLFIYSEDDIRVTPTTVGSYWWETQRIQHLLSQQPSSANPRFQPQDFNVGIVRYEYDYPSNVIIDDKTRHATKNVTRVYWEHSGFTRPVYPNALVEAPQQPLSTEYVTMKNHHQGMYLATSALLKAWKTRCQFDVATNRPGRGSQPTEGTQRVWMSSQMLYGGRHCNVQQVLPMHRFGTLTVLHLPNKNYRRVGKYRKRTFSDGTEVFEKPHESLLKAMELHLGIKQAFPRPTLHTQYRGIRMIDEVDNSRDRDRLLERRMKLYSDYVRRGGILTDGDFARTSLDAELDEIDNDDD